MPNSIDWLAGLWFGGGGSVPLTPVTPASFTLRRGYEGPQVYIEWPIPGGTGGVATMTLVRRLYGFPAGPADGMIIFSGSGASAQSISDRDVTPGICYYYKLFVTDIDGVVTSSIDQQGHVIPITTGFFAQKLWDLLPEGFKNADKRKDINQTTRTRLVEGTDGLTAEVFNIGEDGSIPKGAYRRFLKLFGPMLDEPKGLIDYLSNQIDIDKACLENLTQLAQTVGLDLNNELTPEKIRNEIRQQVPYLKIKGTKPGIVSRLRSVSNTQPVIHEQYHNILYSNDPDTTSLAFTLAEIDSVSSPNDVIFRSVGFPDGPPFWLWFSVFLEAPDDEPLTEVNVRKWCLSMFEGSPACHKGELYVTGTTPDALAVTITDEADDENLDEDEEEISFSLANEASDTAEEDPDFWLLMSDPLHLTDSDSVTAGIGSDYTTPPMSS